MSESDVGIDDLTWTGLGLDSIAHNVVTIFPDFFTGPLSLSIPARAAAAGAVEYRVVDLRDYTHDRHRTVDDYPYGGGAGMVMKPEPFFEAVEALDALRPIVLLSPRGRRFTQDDARRYAAGAELTLLCGHYKDVDQRVADHLATEELSLGDFVLSGGEPAALAVIDATVRLLPGRDERHRQRPRRLVLRPRASARRATRGHPCIGATRCRRCCCRGTTSGSPSGSGQGESSTVQRPSPRAKRVGSPTLRLGLGLWLVRLA